MSAIEKLYEYYEILDANNESNCETEFKSIINHVVSGTVPEIRLASQLMIKFQHQFPAFKVDVLNALLKNCSSLDINIRRQSLKDLELLLRDKERVNKEAAEVVTSRLQSSDSSEIVLVHKCLVTMFKSNPFEALHGIFYQIMNGEDILRERTIKFLSLQLSPIMKENICKEVEEQFIKNCCEVLEDVSGAEFTTIIKLMSLLSSMKTSEGHQKLVDIIAQQAEMGQEFNHNDPDIIARLIHCIKEAMPLFSKRIHSEQYINYLCLKVLPVCDEIPEENVLEILKLLAEIISRSEVSGESSYACLEAVYSRLVVYLPLPDECGSDSSDKPLFQFSYVECLLYTFYQMARHYPEFLSEEADAERLRTFRLRLRYFAHEMQVYIKGLKIALSIETKAGLKSDQNQLKLLAFKTTHNINVLILDLLLHPPSYKSLVNLSFLSLESSSKNLKEDQNGRGNTKKTLDDNDGSISRKHSMKDLDDDRGVSHKRSHMISHGSRHSSMDSKTGSRINKDTRVENRDLVMKYLDSDDKKRRRSEDKGHKERDEVSVGEGVIERRGVRRGRYSLNK